MVDRWCGANENADRREVGRQSCDGEGKQSDGRGGLRAAPGTEDARAAVIASIGRRGGRGLPAPIRAVEQVHRRERGEADEKECGQDTHSRAMLAQHTRVPTHGNPGSIEWLRRRFRLSHDFSCYTYFVKETQNITLALPRTLLKRAKRVAADRDTSVSALLADALARTVDEVEGYAAAKRRHVAGLGKTADLGTGGRATWTRASLHDR